MKSLCFSLLLFISISTNIRAQEIMFPMVDQMDAKDIIIKSVELKPSYTQVNFIYRNSSNLDRYIYCYPTGHKDAFYIRYNNIKYKQISIHNIANRDGITVAKSGILVEFSVRFEKLPSYAKKFDVLEGENGSWHFYGVNLEETYSIEEEEEEEEEEEKFRIDYELVSFYDVDTKEWSDWKESFNTFVFNSNENGDIIHILPGGKKSIYRKLSEVKVDYAKEEKRYQMIRILDQDGDECYLQLFDDPSVGLKIIYGNFSIQFSNRD